MMPVSDTELLLVFLKSPRPGFVKTRLAERIGAEQACAVYRSLTADLLDNLRPYPHVELRIAPDEAVDAHADWLWAGWRCRGQGEGDLGRRLARAFEESFATGCRKVMAIGSDCPDMNGRHLTAGFERLATAALVLGPAKDGGYWLIGMNRCLPTLFEGIDWSSAKVLEQTLQRAAALGVQVAMLETLEDVDDWESWQRYWQTRRRVSLLRNRNEWASER